MPWHTCLETLVPARERRRTASIMGIATLNESGMTVELPGPAMAFAKASAGTGKLEAGLQIRLIEPELPRLFQRIGPEAHRPVFAQDLPVGALVHIFELEEFLRDDDGAFHADHLGDVGHAARAVAQAL